MGGVVIYFLLTAESFTLLIFLLCLIIILDHVQAQQPHAQVSDTLFLEQAPLEHIQYLE